ncbi:TniB family NTP-binding protein [Pelagibius sp. 7325]|uniref:TniB family NTP-binding protein n=1 Tax=Pelagibius sp. 7325 TaxID=3131994 RepID=UPI0030EDCC64
MKSDENIRLDALRAIRVEFGFVKAALKRLSTLHASAPRPREGHVFTIVGESRSGKTTILDLHEEKFASPGPRPRRVARLTLLSKCNERTLAASVLEAMGDPAASTNSRVQSLTRIPMVSKTMGVEMIIIDEAQHLVNRRNKEINYDAADAIKVLADLVGIPIVLAGTEDLDRLIAANLQLEGRLRGRIAIAPFDVSSDDSFKELRCFLRYYDLEMPFPMTGGLHEPHLARAIHSATSGLIGLITRLLQRSGELAIDDGRPFIDLYHLGCAWEELTASSAYGRSLSNPFDRLREPKREEKPQRSD